MSSSRAQVLSVPHSAVLAGRAGPGESRESGRAGHSDWGRALGSVRTPRSMTDSELNTLPLTELSKRPDSAGLRTDGTAARRVSKAQSNRLWRVQERTTLLDLSAAGTSGQNSADRTLTDLE